MIWPCGSFWQWLKSHMGQPCYGNFLICSPFLCLYPNVLFILQHNLNYASAFFLSSTASSLCAPENSIAIPFCCTHQLFRRKKSFNSGKEKKTQYKAEWKKPSLGNLRTEELSALCSLGHAKMQFGGCPALHWKVMVFTELSYDQLFADSLWHTDRAEHRMLLSKSNDTRSVTEWRNICH